MENKMNEKIKKTYLCKEGNKEFYIEANNIEEAKELIADRARYVEINNPVVICAALQSLQ